MVTGRFRPETFCHEDTSMSELMSTYSQTLNFTVQIKFVNEMIMNESELQGVYASWKVLESHGIEK
jgi:hypothetical protein